jgi:hypothetical protein
MENRRIYISDIHMNAGKGFQGLKKLAKNKKIAVLYLPGNHDMGVTRELVEKYFPEMQQFEHRTSFKCLQGVCILHQTAKSRCVSIIR